MDLAKLDTRKFASAGAFLHLEGPDGALLHNDDGEAVGITLLGADSMEYEKERKRVSQKLAENVRLGQGGRLDFGSVDDSEETEITLLAFATKKLHHLSYNGTPYTLENAAEMYRKFPWITVQARAFVNRRINFLGEA